VDAARDLSSQEEPRAHAAERARLRGLPATTGLFDRRRRDVGISSVLDAVLLEVLRGLLRVAASSPEVAEQLGGILGAVRDEAGAGPLLAVKSEYAARLRYSVRKLDELLDAGLPTVGRGRALRIPVQKADDWVLAHLSSDHDGDEDLVVQALASVRKRAQRGRR